MSEASVGKDNDWSLGNYGANIMQPFKVYPEGFPEELVSEIESLTGRGCGKSSCLRNADY